MVADELIKGQSINEEQMKILNQIRFYVNTTTEQVDPSFPGLKQKLNNFVQTYLQMAPKKPNRFKMVTQNTQPPTLDNQLK